MYFPYFRGKQYELIALREMAPLLAKSKIVPILEPVKANQASLQRCISDLKKANVSFVLVVNPKYGDYKNNNQLLLDQIVEKDLQGYTNFQIGYIVDSNSELSDMSSFFMRYPKNKLALIHYGYPDGAVLAEEISGKKIRLETNIFVDNLCGKLYRRYLKGTSSISVLLKDGFNKRKNADYPDDELFSELHLIYEDEAVSAFGDYLTVGDDYSESGGPAWAVAIHLTYFRKDQVINIRHFLSERKDSPVDPAGKFLEALEKLVEAVDTPNSPILKTQAVGEYRQLFQDQHFPGLGYVKKMSMKHHLELMLSFLK